MQLEYGPIIKNFIILKKQLEYERYIYSCTSISMQKHQYYNETSR